MSVEEKITREGEKGREGKDKTKQEKKEGCDGFEPISFCFVARCFLQNSRSG